ncbi:MAG: EAL domain-containing protein [Rhodocyclaceae bacterium]|nr:EAL domain-containing protein [Rhodocyclaceae bacterium]
MALPEIPVEQLRQFFEKNSSVMLLIEPESGRIVAFNEAARRYYGYPAERLAGMNIAAINTLPPEEIARERARALAEERNHFHFRHRLANGEIRAVEVYSTPIVSEEGTLLLSIIHDETERIEATRRLKLFADVFTHASEGVMITDTAGRILEVNDAFVRITGYAREEVIGQTPSLLKSGRQPPSFYAQLWKSLAERGAWAGEIWNRRKSGEVYAEWLDISAVRDEEGRIDRYVAIFSDITAQKEHQRQLEHLAHYDALTGLPNRSLLIDRLRQAMAQAARRRRLLAVAFVDLDGFKDINDLYGHDAGDQLLIQIAERMRLAIREGDTLARLGGDEFVVLLHDLAKADDCAPSLSRLLAAAAQPVDWQNQPLAVTASIGVAFYPQKEELDAEQLLRQADQAMYVAKQAGKNRFHLFDPGHDFEVRSRHSLVEDFRRGLHAGELVLYYQPKVDLSNGRVVGAEALLRWNHPQQGQLSPGQFLPAIESDPLAIDLDEWVIETVLAQIEAWNARGIDLSVSVNVNVGATYLLQRDFMERLKRLLLAHDHVWRKRVTLEILETSALADLSHVAATVREARELGIDFALDDFGVGYSSLSYLKHLPVAELKIDRSFICDMAHDPDDMRIVEAVVGLATAFGRRVVAEGVETAEQMRLVAQLGCAYAQGFHLARPMPAGEFEAWLTHYRPDPRLLGLRPVARGDLPLVFARAEHRRWHKQALAALANRELTPPPDANQCAFGQWMSSEGHLRHGDKPIWTEIVAAHEALHALAKRLMSGQAAAGETIETLMTASDALAARIDTLIDYVVLG